MKIDPPITPPERNSLPSQSAARIQLERSNSAEPVPMAITDFLCPDSLYPVLQERARALGFSIEDYLISLLEKDLRPGH